MANEQQTKSVEQPVHCLRPKRDRLRSGAMFRRVYDADCRAGDGHLLLFATENDTGHLRAGVSVSKKHGNAVQRNRKKRRLREAIRLSQHELPPLDYVLIPRQTSASTVLDYQKSLVALARRLAKRIQRSK